MNLILDFGWFNILVEHSNEDKFVKGLFSAGTEAGEKKEKIAIDVCTEGFVSTLLLLSEVTLF